MTDNSGFDRLVDSDPAVDLHPDLVKLRAATDVLASRKGHLVARPATRRSHFNRRVIGVAAAVVGVLAIGSAGFALGSDSREAAAVSGPASATLASASVASATGAGAAAAPAISLGGGSTEQAGEGQAAGGNFAGGAAAVPTAAGGSGVSDSAGGRAASMPYGFGRTQFSAAGLSTEGGSAKGFAYDPAKIVSAATAKKLADAFGLTGAARQEYGSWIIGSNDGSGPSLTLSGDGMASFNYYNPSAYPTDCGAAGKPEAVSSSAADCTAKDPGVAPSSAEAKAALRALLGTIGLDATGYEIEADDASQQKDKSYAGATAYQVLNGQRTGAAVSISYFGSEMSGAYGTLADIVDFGSYQVISPVEAVARLNDPRFGQSNGVYPANYAVDSSNGAASSTAPSAVSAPSLPAAGSKIAWPVEQVTISSARLGIAQQYLQNGSVLLLPAYALTDTKGVTWSVLAVADSQLDFTAGR